MDNQNEQLTRLIKVEENYKNDIKSYSDKIAKLEEQLQATNTKYPDLEEIIAVKNAELNQLREDLQNQVSKNYDIDHIKAKHEEEIKNYKEEIEELKKKLTNNINEHEINNNLNQEIQLLKDKEQEFEQKLLIWFKKNLYGKITPIPERYLAVGKSCGIEDDNKGLELFWPKQTEVSGRPPRASHRRPWGPGRR